MSAQQITNHDQIRTWAEERGGRPSKVKGAAEGGILRIDFGEPEPNLETISWNEFFGIFEESQLAFLCEETTDGGKTSRFNKFVSRDS